MLLLVLVALTILIVCFKVGDIFQSWKEEDYAAIIRTSDHRQTIYLPQPSTIKLADSMSNECVITNADLSIQNW